MGRCGPGKAMQSLSHFARASRANDEGTSFAIRVLIWWTIQSPQQLARELSRLTVQGEIVQQQANVACSLVYTAHFFSHLTSTLHHR
jgi:hypothetical protein